MTTHQSVNLNSGFISSHQNLENIYQLKSPIKQIVENKKFSIDHISNFPKQNNSDPKVLKIQNGYLMKEMSNKSSKNLQIKESNNIGHKNAISLTNKKIQNLKTPLSNKVELQIKESQKNYSKYSNCGVVKSVDQKVMKFYK